MRANLIFAPFSAATMELAMVQIFCLAPSIRPDIEPVVSRTKVTSMVFAFAGGASVARAWVRASRSTGMMRRVVRGMVVSFFFCTGEAPVPRRLVVVDLIERVFDQDVDVVAER